MNSDTTRNGRHANLTTLTQTEQQLSTTHLCGEGDRLSLFFAVLLDDLSKHAVGGVVDLLVCKQEETIHITRSAQTSDEILTVLCLSLERSELVLLGEERVRGDSSGLISSKGRIPDSSSSVLLESASLSAIAAEGGFP